MKKSLSANAALNTVKTILGIIFPLITFPYVSRILGVNNIGKVNYSNSIVSYFSLIAAYGIAPYAIREGSRIRNNKEQFSEFSNQVFTVNVITTFIAYILLIALVIFSVKIHYYSLLIFILSINIFFTTFGADWLNTIFEDFSYITKRTLIFQVLSLVLLFVFVKKPSDYYKYAIITVISSAGGNICNFFYCKKYTKLKLVKPSLLKKHIVPMFLFFLSNITTIVFLNSDQTMLGWICGDYYVGLYSVSVRIYSILKNLFTAILTVVMPRISYMQANNSGEQIQGLQEKVFNTFILFVVPMSVGLFCVSDGVITLIGGNAYARATGSLRILAISILCSAAASFMTYTVIIPEGKEKVMLKASTVSAVLNVSLNLFFIPSMQEEGAAITTAISEFVVFIMEYMASPIKFDTKKIKKNFLDVMVATLTIPICNFTVRQFVSNTIVATIIIIIFSIGFYYIILNIRNNESVIAISKKIIRKHRKVGK